MAALLLERGASPDMADGFGNTALHHASNFGAGKDQVPVQTMLLLLMQGKPVDIPNKSGMTPLHWAAKSGHSGAASALLAAGANPNARTLEGSTPLLEACSGGYDVKGNGRYFACVTAGALLVCARACARMFARVRERAIHASMHQVILPVHVCLTRLSCWCPFF